MSDSARGKADAPRVALGPVMPGWGSWDWVGADMQEELSRWYRTASFAPGEVPAADLVLVVKHAPDLSWMECCCRRSAVVYCPVDYYGSAAAIDADGPLLRKCARVVVHCERLRRYFAPYAPVEYLDHHVKFVSPLPDGPRDEGPLLWAGVRTNLPALADWLNAHPLPAALVVLSNFEDAMLPPQPADFGFRPGLAVRLEHWSPGRHRELTASARAALDIKGDDFRSRHKPPAKALDFLASGLPLALNPGSSPAEHLARLGFEVPSPLDVGRWLSREYWEETQRFGRAVRELLSRERVGSRLRRILDEVLAERRLPGRT